MTCLRYYDAAENRQWRVIYRIDKESIVVASLFSKSARKTEHAEIGRARKRFVDYDAQLAEIKRKQMKGKS